MLINASRSSGGAALSLDISPVDPASPDGTASTPTFPLCLLPAAQCAELRSLGLTASQPGDPASWISAPDHARALTRALRFATRLTSLTLADVGVSGATVNDIKADAALMGRLEALTLGIGAPDVLDALTGLLQAATALVRLDLRGHSPPTRPLSAAAMSHCAALRRTLVAATRVTHLGLRTTCLDLPCAVELPRLRSLHIDEAVCSSGQRMGVPLSHALRCPQAEAVDVLLRACKRCYYCQ